jgi:hypothetical protein
MTIIQEAKTAARDFSFGDALDRVIGFVPLVLGYIIGLVVRLLKLIAGWFVVGYRRGSKI